MARYGLILRLDGALWLRIIFKPLLTPKGAIKNPKNPKKVLKSVPNQPRSSIQLQLALSVSNISAGPVGCPQALKSQVWNRVLGHHSGAMFLSSPNRACTDGVLMVLS